MTHRPAVARWHLARLAGLVLQPLSRLSPFKSRDREPFISACKVCRGYVQNQAAQRDVKVC